MDLLRATLAFGVLALLGLATGALTGLAPGVHVNNVAAFLLAARGAWAGVVSALLPDVDEGFAGVLLSTYLVAAAVSHAVFDFVPSVFLSAPVEDTALSVLPGQRLLREGRGAQAVALAARGAVLGTLLAAALALPLRWILGNPVHLAERFQPWAAWFLAILLAALALSEGRSGQRPWRRVIAALSVQGLAALLGIVVLRSSLGLDPTVALFPLFAGLFGMPGLVLALRAGPGPLPSQDASKEAPYVPGEGLHALRGALAGAAVSWLPGLSGGAAAGLASLRLRGRTNPESFLVVLGSVATSTTVLSVAVLYMIRRARSGAAAAIRELVGGEAMWTYPDGIPAGLLLLLLAAAATAALAAPMASALARHLGRQWSSVDPRRLAATTWALLGALLLLVSGPLGVAVAGTAVLVGLVPVFAGVRRVHLMASLLVPVLLSYLAA